MNWLKQLFSRRRLYNDLSDEIREHLEEKIEELIASGMSRKEATAAARRQFGNVTLVEQDSREAWRWPSLENLLLDVRYSLRTLRKNPGFTCIAVLTLTLGIGANTAIFSMVNALLLHPYDFRKLDQLAKVWEDRGIDEGIDARRISAPDAVEVRARTQVFESLTNYRCREFNLAAAGDVQPVRGCEVSANFFEVLGVSPAMGRPITVPTPSSEK